MAAIHKAMVSILREVGAVEKGRKNEQQNYKFRGIDDIYNEVHPLFAKHGVFNVPEVLEQTRSERPTGKGGVLTYSVLRVKIKFMCEDESCLDVTVVGEGMDSGDKASNKAMTAAMKNAVINMLTLPTADEKDSENDSPEPAPRQQHMRTASDLPPATAPAPADPDKQALIKILKTCDCQPKPATDALDVCRYVASLCEQPLPGSMDEVWSRSSEFCTNITNKILAIHDQRQCSPDDAAVILRDEARSDAAARNEVAA
jgi:hypothetical protein